MRRTSLWVMVLVVFAAMPALPAGAGVSLTESWDAHSVDQPPGSPWYVDPHYGRSPWVDDAGAQRSSPYSLLINNDGFYGADLGIQALLPISGGMPEVAATDANALIVDYFLFHDSAGQRGQADIYVEISLSDTHAPPLGTVLPSPIAVLAFCKPRSSNAACHYFDGQQWFAAGFADWGSWDEMIMAIGTTTVSLEKRGTSTYGPYANVPRSYLGNFDRISIRTVDFTATTWTSLDDLTVSGGVGVPEPATMVLLAIGGLLTFRRRHA
jgi:hypothetical protein